MYSRILDLLLDINSSAQIPPSRRIDMEAEPDDAAMDVDDDRPAKKSRTYRGLLRDVRHIDFAKAVAENRYPQLLSDLDVTPWEGAEASSEGKQEKAAASATDAAGKSGAKRKPGISSPQPLPAPSFVTPDALDDYIYAVDLEIRDAILAQTGQAHEPDSRNGHDESEPAEKAQPIGSVLLPTLAPSAKRGATKGLSNGVSATTNGVAIAPKPSSNGTSQGHGAAGGVASNRSFATHNPASTYNWLRKHAPNTLTQDNIDAASRADDDDDDDEEDGHHQRGGAARKSAGMSAAAKRRSAAHRDEDGNIPLRADGRPLTGPGSRGGKGSRGGRVRGASGDRRGSVGAERMGRAKRLSGARAADSSHVFDSSLVSVDEDLAHGEGDDGEGDGDGDGDSTIAALDSAAATPSSVGGGGGGRGGVKRKRPASAADDDAGYNPRSGSRKRARRGGSAGRGSRPSVAAAAEDDGEEEGGERQARPKTGRGSRGGRGAGSRGRGGRKSNMTGERIIFDQAEAGGDDDGRSVKKEPVDDENVEPSAAAEEEDDKAVKDVEMTGTDTADVAAPADDEPQS